jgi:hypothetical protein
MDEPQLIVFHEGAYHSATLLSRDDVIKDGAVKRDIFIDFTTLGEKVGNLEDFLPIPPTLNLGLKVIPIGDGQISKAYDFYKLAADKMRAIASLREVKYYTIDSVFSFGYAPGIDSFAIFPTGQLLMEKRSK